VHLAEFVYLSQVSGWRNDNPAEGDKVLMDIMLHQDVQRSVPRFALDWFHEEGGYIVAVQIQSPPQIRDLAEPDRLNLVAIDVRGPNPSKIGSEATTAFRIRAHAAQWRSSVTGHNDIELHGEILSPDNANRPSMEVTCRAEHNGLSVRNPLPEVGPLPGELDPRLDRFRAGVHRKHHVIPEHGRYLLREPAEHRIVKRARAQSESLRLRDKRRDDSRVAMTLKARREFESAIPPNCFRRGGETDLINGAVRTIKI
jgi:hypothetical protein